VIKGGTSSLFWYLSQHEDICASDVKETQYFLPLRSERPLPPIEAYASHFAHHKTEPLLMEATPEYFLGGQELAKAMDATLPDLRIVISLREPVARFLSHYNAARSGQLDEGLLDRKIPKSISPGEYLDRCEELRAKGLDELPENRAWWGLCIGLYDHYLDEWINIFGNRLYVVFFEDLVAAPHREVAALCDWLGLDATPARAFEYSVENRTVQYRSRLLQHWAGTFNERHQRTLNRHRRLKRPLRALYYMVNGRNDEGYLDSATADRLSEHYRPSNRRLQELLTKIGRSGWPEWVTRVD
jgi:hypothetical protein